MEPRRSTMWSPFTALLVDCVAPVWAISARGGANCVMRMGGGRGVVARRPGGDTGRQHLVLVGPMPAGAVLCLSAAFFSIRRLFVLLLRCVW